MKHLILAALCLFGLVNVTQADEPTTFREFDLESKFCRTVLLFMDDPHAIMGEPIESVELKKGILYRPDKGIILYRNSRDKVSVKREELWFKSYLIMSQKSLVIGSSLDDESNFFDHSVVIFEFHENKDGGTKVKMSLWIDADVSPFFLRLGARVKLFKAEKNVREMVGEQLSEDD